jgi:hypothetical protein
VDESKSQAGMPQMDICSGCMPMQAVIEQKISYSNRNTAVQAFLGRAFANGPVAVAELEKQARAAAILAGDSSITHSKLFKRAKRALGIRSVRHGFGPEGTWLWTMPLPPGSEMQRSVNRASTEPLPAVINGAEQIARRPIGVPLEWTNGVASLDRHRAPTGVPLHRWIQFICDSEQFIDLWAAWASALGWDATSLFACVPTQPLANLNRAGLVWVLSGRKLIRLYPDWASIESTEGSLHVFNRRAAIYEGQIALPWCLR